MAASIIITKDKYIMFLNNTFHNLNLSNIEFINDLFKYFVDNKNATYYYKTLKPIFIDPLKHLKTVKLKGFTEYWLCRGWSLEEAKNQIKQHYLKKGKIFFSNDEIYSYLITENPYQLNLNNISNILNFISTIKYYDHITNYQINNYWSLWCNLFYQSRNKGFVCVTKTYYIARGYSDEEAEKIISTLQKENSPRSTTYYTKRGYSEKEAKLKVSEVLKNNASYSKNTKQYWLNLGLSLEEAQKKAAHYTSLTSAWNIQYWINQGYTKEDAIKKTRECNASCPECKCYNGDIGLYINSINNIKQRQTKLWESITKNKLTFINNITMKSAWLKNTSKAENNCFEYLIQNINANIKHVSYIVLFPQGFQSQLNNYFYACDGYLLIDEQHVIIIEYDGGIGVYHTPEKDLIRDKEILLLDNNVLGILRILETFFKNNNITYINEQINYGLQKIKNCEEERIILS